VLYSVVYCCIVLYSTALYTVVYTLTDDTVANIEDRTDAIYFIGSLGVTTSIRLHLCITGDLTG